MVKLLKNHLSLCAFSTAILFFVPSVNAKVEGNPNDTNVQASAVVNTQVENGENQSRCDENASPYRCSDGKLYKISGKTYQLTNHNDNKAVAIEVSNENTDLTMENITVKGVSNVRNHSEKSLWETGVKVSEKARVHLLNSTLSDVSVGLNVNGRGAIHIMGGEIDAIKIGLSVIGSDTQNKRTSLIMVKGTKINTKSVGAKAENKGKIILEDFSVTVKGSQESENRSENSAFYMLEDSHIYFLKGKVDVTDAHGLLLQGKGNNSAYGEDSVVTVKGHRYYGMRLLGEVESGDRAQINHLKESDEQEKISELREIDIDLVKTDFTVPNSTAIYSSNSKSSIKLFKGARLSGDLLLRADKSSSVLVHSDASALIGGTRVDENSIAEFRLQNNSKWVLLHQRHKKLQDSNFIGVSSISSLNLYDSSLIFEQPNFNSGSNYQTLHIGRGSGFVYQAAGNAWIHLNARLDPSDSSSNQVTDRLLIHGDVWGKTTVHVQAVSGRVREDKQEAHSVSIIQVYGNADSDSFRLNGGYVTLDGAPYKYVLRSYGPSATVEEEHRKQRFVEGDKRFWNFRLENQYVVTSPDYRDTPAVSESTPPERISVADIIPPHSAGFASAAGVVSKAEPVSQVDPVSRVEPVSHSGRAVRSVVPQVPTYLLLPNSVFHAGLVDINNQNKQLEILRTPSSEMVETHEKPVSFLRGYGGSYRYVSDLSVLEYGYGGDLSYNALEAGVLLQTIENANSAISFGVMGTYGKLSLQPVDVEQSQKSTFDKWTATVYGSMQHDAGFYVDGLLSYGAFKGDVLTLARGKTATLKANPFSVSLTGGKAFATGYEGFVVDPQVQVVYQHLHFDKAYDIDKFDIEMGKLGQWVARVGGRLSKMFSASEKERDVSMYGKLYFTHAFEEKQTVHFKDAFQLGAFGSSLEAGLGFNAKLSQKFALHADLSYQHKLNKAGFSGISFSGGLRYRF
ncbi:outer membrane autotransporter barrel domain-containing protein [Bartonella vinsonii subsp. arupensis Pm136co]|uniref:Outer membrane autotransporter barrel domain-containing protein n=1 Tax=Bartonella vinsonii subsp. arupensis Pm136co TaxID=1094561 RepID=A0ABN0GNZ3_BARVI|nr:autotransporter outer membrane beta-barrel domain-containing protein [Bartonella vinsonii]EJF97944.1 outer membrane autotransporter barrel domain-containing protein [Bartonella vinsonii subsp. arupensis Pm136co]